MSSKRSIQLLLTTVAAGLLLYPWTGSAQVTQEKSEAGEVQITTTLGDLVEDVQANLKNFNEVEVRNLSLVGNQLNETFLSMMTSQNVLLEIRQLTELTDGKKVDIRTTSGERFRVQKENGQLRIRMRDVNPEDANALATFFSMNGFGRVEIRTLSGIRVEMRNGVVKKNETEADHKGRGHEGTSASINNERAKDRSKDLDHSLRGTDRARERHEKVEREREHRKAERMERGHTRPERMERIDRPSRPERAERSEGHGRGR